jgi:hypothetical protein
VTHVSVDAAVEALGSDSEAIDGGRAAAGKNKNENENECSGGALEAVKVYKPSWASELGSDAGRSEDGGGLIKVQAWWRGTVVRMAMRQAHQTRMQEAAGEKAAEEQAAAGRPASKAADDAAAKGSAEEAAAKQAEDDEERTELKGKHEKVEVASSHDFLGIPMGKDEAAALQRHSDLVSKALASLEAAAWPKQKEKGRAKLESLIISFANALKEAQQRAKRGG